MFDKNTQTMLKTKYKIYIKDYAEEDQIEIMKSMIERNTQIIDIYQQKINLLEEITNDMSEFLNRGDKVASK